MLSYIEIYKENLHHNINVFKKIINKNTRIIAVVKANAYGHGLCEVVKHSFGFINIYGVNTVEEAILVRSITNKDIFILGYIPLLDTPKVIALKATIGVYNAETVKKLNIESKKSCVITPVYIKLDALLGRQGILLSELPKFISRLKAYKNLNILGIYTHFANIEDTTNFNHAQKQISILEQAKKYLQNHGIKTAMTHISATSGVLEYEKNKGMHEYVRIGLGLYGLWPSIDIRENLEDCILLKPILRWVTHIAQIKILPKGYPIGYGLTYITKKPTRIAVIPQGYSDGYDRKLSNTGEVLIHGERCAVLGRVAMNMFVVNVNHLQNVKLEDEVVLLGWQGKDKITAEEIAEKIGTINYEVVARISPLLPRVVV